MSGSRLPSSEHSALDVIFEVLNGPPQTPERGESKPLPYKLGSLSEIYESGGRGPGTVSSGLRDPGGVSYGTYQLASKTGAVADFLRGEGVRWSREFLGRAPGTAAFSAAWRKLAAREAETFADAQHAFIERTHYRPVVSAVRQQTGLDLDARARSVRDAAWSCAVQHGRAAMVLGKAVTAADRTAPRTSAGYDRTLLEAIYAVRGDYVRGLAATAAPGVRRTMQDIAARRYPAELRAALAMLDAAD